MGKFFDCDEVEPLVFELIGRLYAATGQLVSHRQLKAALLADPQGQQLVADAVSKDPEGKSADFFAGNMVAWFSQRITMGDSPFGERLEREQRRDGYADWPAARGN